MNLATESLTLPIFMSVGIVLFITAALLTVIAMNLPLSSNKDTFTFVSAALAGFLGIMTFVTGVGISSSETTNKLIAEAKTEYGIELTNKQSYELHTGNDNDEQVTKILMNDKLVEVHLMEINANDTRLFVNGEELPQHINTGTW